MIKEKRKPPTKKIKIKKKFKGTNYRFNRYVDSKRKCYRKCYASQFEIWDEMKETNCQNCLKKKQNAGLEP